MTSTALIRQCLAGSMLSLIVIGQEIMPLCAQILPGDCGYYKGRIDLLKGAKMIYARDLNKAYVKIGSANEVECLPTQLREWNCGGRSFDIKGFSTTETSFIDATGKLIQHDEKNAHAKRKRVCDFSQPDTVYDVYTSELWYDGSDVGFPLYVRTETRHVYTLSRP